MCCSAVGQIAYGIVMFTALALTIVGMATPGWRKAQDTTNQVSDDIKNLNIPSGIWPGCSGWIVGSDTDDITTSSPQDCKNTWANLKTWNKVVIIAVCLAVITEILALAWNLLTFCACCCKRHLLHPLTGLAVAASIFLAITVIVFGIHNSDSICDYHGGTNVPDCEKYGKTSANYSFYVICGALGCSLLSIVIGIVASCFADHSL